jgi:hypothetical protein
MTSQSIAQQNAILGKLGVEQGTESERSGRFGTSVLNYVTSKLRGKERDREGSLLRTEIINTIRNASESHHKISDPANMPISENVRRISHRALLASLSYDLMKDREGRISEAHESTFQWLFTDGHKGKWTNFRDWLQSGDNLYWITGKPGSGKSTLMKYICSPVKSTEELDRTPRCHEYLTRWSGKKKLIIATFYFWNSGIEMQTTEKGLLMSLLQSILEQCPDLAPLACPTQWEALCLFGDESQEWQEQELRDSLRRAAQTVDKLDATLALFVDGLDEYVGKPEELISLFQSIVGLPNIKLCVASRPWVEFEDAFKHKPSLLVQNLTHDDIKSFVTAKFHGEPIFAELLRREEEFANKLIEDVVSKADGVFLWVALVVSSLLSGMAFGDRVSDLNRRLDLLPPDLGKLYEKMLLSLDPFYLEHAAQLFSLVRASEFPLPLLVASFADEDDLAFALRCEIRPLTNDEAVLRMNTMRRRINSRCKGLLEIKGLTPGSTDFTDDVNYMYFITVQYLHRTVKDYIEGDHAQKVLQSAARSMHDPALRLLAGNIAYLKGFCHFTDPDPSPLINQVFIHCMQLGHNVLPSSIPRMILLVDELQTILSALDHVAAPKFLKYSAFSVVLSGSNIEYLIPSTDLSRRYSQVTSDAFLSLAVRYGNVEYVRAKAATGCLIQLPTSGSDFIDMKHEWPLLIYALPGYSFSRRRLEMIHCLLDKGADPNYKFNIMPLMTSPLSTLLCMMLIKFGTPFTDRDVINNGAFEAARLFIRAGGIENGAIDRALMQTSRLSVTFHPLRLTEWNTFRRARSAFCKALQDLSRSENGNISELEHLGLELLKLCTPFDINSRMLDPYKYRPRNGTF